MKVPPVDLRIKKGPFRDIKYYLESGRKSLMILIEYKLIDSKTKVIDFGCGCGRVGQHIIDYLSESGRYLGIDIEEESIEWCKKHLQTRRNTFIKQDIKN